jgi:hypothetical protein
MLGEWLRKQRAECKKGVLNQARQERLESLGVLYDPFEAQWMHHFGLLSAYRARERHADVPRQHEEAGVMLGAWLSTQRVDFKKGKLDQARKERLESLGVLWDPIEAQWEHNFSLLSAYRAREGHADVPKSHDEEGVMLGAWLIKQRAECKKGKLSQARQERLESLGVLWDPSEAQWEHNFGLLSAYEEAGAVQNSKAF